MEDFVRRVYLGELLRQAENAIASIGEVNALLAAPNMGAGQRVPGVLKALDDFLGDAARIRLMLWPTRKAAAERGQALRTELAISADNPLSDATLRHHLEHFDERLDAWVAESPNRIFVDHILGPRNSIGGVEPGDILRHFVPNEAVYLFRGEEFDIQALVNSVVELIPRVREALDRREAQFRT